MTIMLNEKKMTLRFIKFSLDIIFVVAALFSVRLLSIFVVMTHLLTCHDPNIQWA
jgi:hypothetical protein